MALPSPFGNSRWGRGGHRTGPHPMGKVPLALQLFCGRNSAETVEIVHSSCTRGPVSELGRYSGSRRAIGRSIRGEGEEHCNCPCGERRGGAWAAPSWAFSAWSLVPLPSLFLRGVQPASLPPITGHSLRSFSFSLFSPALFPPSSILSPSA